MHVFIYSLFLCSALTSPVDDNTSSLEESLDHGHRTWYCDRHHYHHRLCSLWHHRHSITSASVEADEPQYRQSKWRFAAATTRIEDDQSRLRSVRPLGCKRTHCTAVDLVQHLREELRFLIARYAHAQSKLAVWRAFAFLALDVAAIPR